MSGVMFALFCLGVFVGYMFRLLQNRLPSREHRCPWPFCNLALPSEGAICPDDDEYVVEECDGCGRKIKWDDFDERYQRVL